MGADCPQVSQFNPVPASPAQSISWSEIDLHYQQNVVAAAQAVQDEQGLTAFITPPLSLRLSPTPYFPHTHPSASTPASPPDPTTAAKPCAYPPPREHPDPGHSHSRYPAASPR